MATFDSVLSDMAALHHKKNKDYGRDGDPHYNIRQTEEFGVASWVGSLIRANDKMKRLQLAAQGGTLANEGIEDSLIDLANYAVIALVEWRNAQ